MAQADYSIANQGFPATRAEINSTLEAIATNNSGTSAPSTQYAGQFWIDTTSSTWTLYIHDGTDDIQFATIDTSANTVNFTDSALDVVTDTTPQLGGNLDLNSNDITGTGDINITGSLTASGNLTSLGIDDNATSTAITIGSDETVEITSSSQDILYLNSSHATNCKIKLQGGYHPNLFSQLTESAGAFIVDVDANNQETNSNFRVKVKGSEAMRIDSSGNLLVGTTNTAPASLTTGSGVKIAADGSEFARQSNVVLFVNRAGTDGEIVRFRHQGTTEGNISVSGSTVSYNGFTGTHWSRLTDNSKPTILRGTVLESLDEMCDWYNLEFDVTIQDEDGNDVITTKKVPHVLTDTQSNGDVITYDWNTEKKDENDNDIIEQVQATIVKEADIKHVKSKVSDTVDAKNVYGVFYSWDDNDEQEGYNDFYVASVGSFVVRIKANETIAKGDLLQSNGDGTAKVQTDDNVKSSSFAKVLSTTVIETYDDGSFIVPCSLMC